MLDEQEKQRVKELCDRIAKEQYHKQFSILIAQLNALLDESDLRTDSGRTDSGRSHVPPSAKKDNSPRL